MTVRLTHHYANVVEARERILNAVSENKLFTRLSFDVFCYCVVKFRLFVVLVLLQGLAINKNLGLKTGTAFSGWPCCIFVVSQGIVRVGSRRQVDKPEN
jgi:hypothetical protein